MNGKTRTVALAMTGLVALGGVAACGGNSSGGGSNGGSNSSAPAKPVASLDNLTGLHTQVILDSGFVKALGSLHVTPGLIGPATFKGGTLTFPITGGTATYYTPGTRTPYVESMIRHDGSGFTLKAGGKTVGLKNFVVDAGKSVLTGDVTLNGATAASNAPLFILNGKTLQPLDTSSKPGYGILYGTKVYLTDTAATLLSSKKVFNLPAGTLSNQTLIGVARITLKLPSS